MDKELLLEIAQDLASEIVIRLTKIGEINQENLPIAKKIIMDEIIFAFSGQVSTEK